MTNYMVRALAKEAGIRAFAVLTTDLVREGVRRHQTYPLATVALGESLTGGALMGALLKVRQRIAIKFSGEQNKIIVEAESNGEVRAYVQNPIDDRTVTLTDFQLGEFVGEKGVTTAVWDYRYGNLHEGVVPMVEGNVADNLTHYLIQSEQVSSLMAVGVHLGEQAEVTVAGGLLVQAMPEHQPGIIEQIQERLQELPPMVALLHEGKTPEEILEMVLAGIEYEILEERPLTFQCSCSRVRAEQGLLALGYDDLKDLIETEGEAEIDCHFCHERYHFDKAELEGLLLQAEA